MEKNCDYAKIRIHHDLFVTLQQLKSRVCVSFHHHVSDDEMEDECDKIALYYYTQFERLLSHLKEKVTYPYH